MRAPHPGLRQAARRLGREIAPDLAAASAAVERRALERGAARRIRREPWLRRAPLAAVAVVAMGVVPALAGVRLATPDGAGVAGLAGGDYGLPPARAGAAVASAGVDPMAGSDVAFAPEVAVTRAPASTSAAAFGGACGDRDLVVETAFDRDAYAFGASSKVILVLRNVSDRSCTLETDRCASGISVLDAAGNVVYRSDSTHSYLCRDADGTAPAAPVSQTMVPGQGMTMAFEWTLQACAGADPGVACTPLPIGRYRVTAFWARPGGSDPAAPDGRVEGLPRHLTVG